MLNRRRMLLVHGVSAEDWAARYGLRPESYPCYECGRELTMTMPFALGRLRGLVAPTCVCGNQATPYCAVHAAAGTDIADVFGDKP